MNTIISILFSILLVVNGLLFLWTWKAMIDVLTDKMAWRLAPTLVLMGAIVTILITVSYLVFIIPISVKMILHWGMV